MTDIERPEDAFWPYWVEAARQQGFKPEIEAAFFSNTGEYYFLDTDMIFRYAAYSSSYAFEEAVENMDLHEFKAGLLDYDGDPIRGKNLGADMRGKFITAIRETLNAHARAKS
ncbi:hypothetical protein [Pseudomonas sp. B22(2017)]|uniref:hypothetical protein n=1 Tax=Pseudomonas sp. B22(2017) TaxID=1981736 RepID=UPI000A1FE99D|nr:hypothetical protein [Pseudomonas sp. B22(2017)]